MNEEIWSGHVTIDARPIDQRITALERRVADLEAKYAVISEDEDETDERLLMDDTADGNDPVETLKGVEALDEIFPGFRQWCEAWNKDR